MAIPAALGLARPVELGELNEALRRSGTPALGTMMPSVSLSLASIWENGLVVEPRYRFTIGTNDQVALVCHHVLLDVGWVVIDKAPVLVYPVIGGGYGTTSLELTNPEVTERDFDEELATPVGDAFLANNAFLLHAGVAVNLWGSGHGDFVGLRTGLIWSVIDAGWKRRGIAVHDGPPAPLSLAYLSIALGFDIARR